MRYIMVAFTDTSVLECERVRDSHRFWRMISKYCKWAKTRVYSVSVKAVND